MKYTSTLAVVFGLCLPLAAQDALTTPLRVGVGVTKKRLSLQESVEAALQANLEIEIEKTNIGNAEQLVKAAQGAFDPSFRYLPAYQEQNTPTGSILQGSGGKLTDKYFNNNFYLRQRLEKEGTYLGLDFTNSRQDTTNPFTSFSPFNSAALVLSFTQPLVRNRITDRDRTEIRIRRKNVNISETDFELKVIDVVSRVELAYWDLVGARQDEGVLGEAVTLARQQLSINQRLITNGMLAPVELAASEAELQRRLDDYYASLENITRTENTLKTLIAGSRQDTIWGDELIPTDDHSIKPPLIDELNESVSQALRRRPELRRIRLQQESTGYQRKLAEDQRKPQVDVVANYTMSGLGGIVQSGPNPLTASTASIYSQLDALSKAAGIPSLPTPVSSGPPTWLVGNWGTALGNVFTGRYQSFQAGISLDMTFRNRTANASLAQTGIQQKRLALQEAQAEQEIQSQLRNALQAIETAKQRITAAEAAARAAKEKLDSETRVFQNGESTNFLVLTRQNEFADARRRSVAASLDLNKAVARLQQAQGSTLETYKVVLH